MARGIRTTLFTLLTISAPVLCHAAAPSAPATQPAVETAAPREPVKVLVLPLDEVSEGEKRQWIGRAMHQSMLAELSRLRFVDPLTSKDPAADSPAADVDEALKAGRGAGAEYVVFGSYQIVEEDLRVTGQLLDVTSGKVAGGLKATGGVRDLFGIEDILAAQLKRELMSAVQPTDAELGLPATASRDPFKPEIKPTGPVTQADQQPPVGYDGSALQKAMREPSPLAEALKDSYDKYRFGNRTPSYYPDYGYYPPYGYDYYPYRPRRVTVIIPDGVSRGITGGKTGAGQPAIIPENRNYNTSPSGGADNRPIGGNYNKAPSGGVDNRSIGGNYNKAPSGGVDNRSTGGNSNSAPGGGAGNSSTGGNTVRSSSGNAIAAPSGNSNTGTSGNSNSR